MTSKYAAALCLAASLSAAMPAAALQAAQAPAIPTPTGPQIPGLCLISSSQVFSNSQLGQHIARRLNEIANQSIAEVTTAQQNIEAERSNLRALVQNQGEAAVSAQIEAYNQKAQQFLDLRSQRDAEQQATENAARQQFDQAVSPVVLQVSQQKNCSMIMEFDMLIVPDPRANITPDLVTALNSRVTTIPIERQNLTRAPAPGTPGAPAAGAR